MNGARWAVVVREWALARMRARVGVAGMGLGGKQQRRLFSIATLYEGREDPCEIAQSGHA